MPKWLCWRCLCRHIHLPRLLPRQKCQHSISGKVEHHCHDTTVLRNVLWWERFRLGWHQLWNVSSFFSSSKSVLHSQYDSQCFCGATPNFAQATKVNDSTCSTKCATDPSQSCGATYVMSLLQITNPQTAAAGTQKSTAYTPACMTSPLCSQQICNTSLSLADRVASLVNSLTQEEKILNLVDSSAGSTRLGLPPYEV